MSDASGAGLISARVRSMLRMTMADMAELADGTPGAFRLENADTYLTPPEHVLAATRAAVGSDEHNSYLPLRGLGALREAIAERYEADFGLDYAPEGEIVVTSGAGEAMLNALLVLCDPGDRVLLTNPTYSGMAQRVRLAGAEQVFTSLPQPHANGGARWSLDPDDVRAAAAGCKLIFVASPCMPTGTVFTEAETRLLAELAIANDAVVVFNGHADKVAFDGRRVINPASLPGMRERTVTVGSVSKNYGMPGWRIGWVAGPRELVAPMEDTHIFNGIMASGFAQAGAIAALTGPQQWQRDMVAAYQRNRDVLLAELGDAGGVHAVAAEGGYYLLADVEATGLDAVAFSRRLLAEQQVAVTPMSGWGSDDFGQFQVRMIFTNEPPERLREAGHRIATFAREAAGA